MTESHVLSASGTITKKEYVRNVKNKSLKQYLVLESTDPFPDATFKQKSSFVKFYYVAVKADRLDQDIKIAAQAAEGQMKEEIASALGEIRIDEKTFYTIRLRNISAQILPLLIKAYEYEGIKMHPFRESIQDYAWIHVRKFFHLEEIQDGIYTDLDDPFIGYVEVPRKLKWGELEEITRKAKTDTRYPNFDRALGSISKRGEPKEIIRIYSPDMSDDVIEDISQAFRKHFNAL